ncbi:hypothetical protein DCU91_000998 [Salmonella enterica subsp. enterica]|uniref:Eaa protein n=1 Tax=Salmonella enterica TaxID=28901 RepID=A0A622CWH1_SALER|nr:hypothetical protein [Salmonella enterica subsp. enterica serovar Alachua]ECY8988004.1 hypothetical protein [Salmonella enterica subsp. enterica serovar Alachua]EDT2447340.1 hypothetical protein [Salmonella enterica subsp. enterica]EDU0983560.1 hypothetical protein [Salmonella enterica subsp. enterica]
MTTNNHPAHGPVSLDRLHQISEILSKAAVQSDGDNIGYAMADAVKVIDGAIAAFGAEPVDGAIAAFGAEPVGTFRKGPCGYYPSFHEDAVPLYDTPPAPVVPPERPADSSNGDDVEAWFDEGCRAAMLQAGNSPVTPDGWQLVPKEPTQAMNKAGWDAMNEHDAINPTYRAMLAAAPKQENF